MLLNVLLQFQDLGNGLVYIRVPDHELPSTQRDVFRLNCRGKGDYTQQDIQVSTYELPASGTNMSRRFLHREGYLSDPCRQAILDADNLRSVLNKCSRIDDMRIALELLQDTPPSLSVISLLPQSITIV